jgi:CheY-like chemotaxis protein
LSLDPGDPTRLLFSVEDTGVGIAPEELGLLFNAFSQTSSGKRAQQGAGLGLAISRAFVQMLGGEIRVKSQPGEGSCFEFDLRVSPLTQLEAEALPHGRQPRALGLQPGQRAVDGGPYRILVVDDVEANLRLMADLLNLLGQPVGAETPAASGFEIRLAGNGQEAIQVWESWQPHLIWMDIRMPVMDGTEATRYIKAQPGGRATVIIALTASVFEEERLQALSSGFDDFVRKPLREKFIVAALTEHLGIKFVYEGSAPVQRASETSHPAILPDQPLSAVPAEWLEATQLALLEGDLQQLRSLAQQIHLPQPDLGERMTQMIENFELDELSRLTQALQPETGAVSPE